MSSVKSNDPENRARGGDLQRYQRSKLIRRIRKMIYRAARATEQQFWI